MTNYEILAGNQLTFYMAVLKTKQNCVSITTRCGCGTNSWRRDTFAPFNWAPVCQTSVNKSELASIVPIPQPELEADS